MNKRQDDYYDTEANVYSQKRYPKRAGNYIQFLFTRRRDIVLSFVGRIVGYTPSPRSLFEMGCADGVLLRAIDERFPNAFDEMLGSDISLPMIEEGRKLTPQKNIHYAIREDALAPASFTCALEIGVSAIVLDTAGELSLFSSKLMPGGYLVASVAGRDSIAARWGSIAADRVLLKRYREYETEMTKQFSIESVRSCGTFMPLVWRVPLFGSFIQPILEVIGSLIPELAHERVYLLKKK